MDHFQGKVNILQESLRSLNLEPDGEDRIFRAQNILLGKILSTMSFRRFTVTEIITKTWRVRTRVQIEKIGENCFKFLFGSREEKENIYRGRPWSLNGAHLILKEWSDEKSLNQIEFDYSTFHIQIHGLPPIFLHERTAVMLGSKIGIIHKESVNRRSVIAQRYLRFRVDIQVENPLPTGFFLEREDGDIWIQFKLERLLDFCYKCGVLQHVTGRCKFRDPVMVTTPNGISARLYGPWLKTENNESLLFINTPEIGAVERKMVEVEQEAGTGELARITKKSSIGK